MKRNIATTVLLLIVLVAHTYAEIDSIGIKWINGTKYIIHKVEKSQGLYAISRRYGVPVEDIKEANNNIETLALDQEILVPAPKVSVEQKTFFHEVEKGETLYKIAKLYNVSVENLKKWNNLTDDALKEGTQVKVIQEVKSIVVDTKQGDKQSGPAVSKSKVKSGEIVEEGIATWIEDQSIDSRKALALHKKAPVGTIILVTNLMNDKQVYVKVVGNLGEENSQTNEIIKLSKYTAKQLKIRDQLTRVRLSYNLE